jgi:phage anti-repressor protein
MMAKRIRVKTMTGPALIDPTDLDRLRSTVIELQSLVIDLLRRERVPPPVEDENPVRADRADVTTTAPPDGWDGELIPVFTATIGGIEQLTCNARDLHRFLAVGRDFSTWIKERISEYGFEEGDDYILFDSPNSGNQTGRGGDRRRRDYHLTLDMAKELAMVERNDQGRRVRQYFIACERRVMTGMGNTLSERSSTADRRGSAVSRGALNDDVASMQSFFDRILGEGTLTFVGVETEGGVENRGKRKH